MRPDTRSFSFTWMKGNSQKSLRNASSSNQQHRRFENADAEEMQMQQAQAVQGEVEKSQSTATATATGEQSRNGSEEGSNATASGSSGWGRRGSSGSRLRKLSNSLVKLRRGNRYAAMEDIEDENNWQKISEEPLDLEDEEPDHEEMRMDIHMEPDVVVVSRPKQPVPFKPLENNVLARDNGNGSVESGEGQEEGTGTGTALSLSKRLNKTVQDVKASLGHFSQRFRKSTRRRYRMGPNTPGSMTSPTRKILGRTPTKLYSPFGIESPLSIKTPKRLVDRPSTPRLTRKSMISGLVYSPSNNFRRDLDDARRGMQDFHILSRDITRRSVRF